MKRYLIGLVLSLTSITAPVGPQQLCKAVAVGTVPVLIGTGYHYHRSYIAPQPTVNTLKPFATGVAYGTVPLIGLPICAAKALKCPQRPLEKPTAQGVVVGLGAYATTTLYLLRHVR